MIRLYVLMGPDKEALDAQLAVMAKTGWLKHCTYNWHSNIGDFYAYQLINVTQPSMDGVP